MNTLDEIDPDNLFIGHSFYIAPKPKQQPRHQAAPCLSERLGNWSFRSIRNEASNCNQLICD
jgi:hypothetical protein